MDTDFLGTLAVTQAMLPMLHRSSAGRIMNVSSGLGSLSMPADPDGPAGPWKLRACGSSKAALNMMTVQLALADAGGPNGTFVSADGAVAW